MFYVEEEGGLWTEWPPGHEFDEEWLEQRDMKAVPMGSLRVHAFSYVDRRVSRGAPVWDCMNGWTS